MIYWNQIPISNKEKEVSIYLYDYRLLTNEQLRILVFGHLKSNKKGQRDNISRYTSALRKKNFVQCKSLYPFSRELVFYLTAKGVEFVKSQINIEPNNEMAGFGDCYGDFDAKILKPPLKNIEHTMMVLNFAVKHPKNVRHNLYAVQEYHYLSQEPNQPSLKKGKVKPDGEYLTKKKNRYALEIDTGTERMEQLLSKFENYRRYFDYCKSNSISLPWQGILFVAKTSSVNLDKDQRIKTILEAASRGLCSYCWTIPVKILNRGGENVTTDFKNLLIQQNDLVRKLNIPMPATDNTPTDSIQYSEIQKKEEEARKAGVEEILQMWDTKAKEEATMEKEK